MSDKKTETLAPDSPGAAKFKGIVLSKEKRERLGTALWNSIDQALGSRSDLDDALDSWNDLFEMRVDSSVDFPWPNASNVFIPMIPTMITTMVSRLTGTVFVPRFFNVSGNDQAAAEFAHEVERYYNTELWRHAWYEAFFQATQLAIRDGSCAMEVLWKRVERKRKVVLSEPDVDPTTGMPLIDPATGGPQLKTRVEEILVKEYDDVELTPVALKDLLLIPAWSPTIEDALACGRALWLDEDELLSMASGDKPVLWLDAVKAALEYVTPGDDERSQDRQGTSTADAGGRIDVVGDVGASDPDLHMARGALKIWRVHTKQFDLDNDGVTEEYIAWVHEQSGKLLGFQTYPYFHGQRPFILLCPDPRPGQAYGYSIVERLAPLQQEINALHNARNNMTELYLHPPILQVAGATMRNREKTWGPGTIWDVGQITDVQFMQMPQIPESAWMEETWLMQYAERLTGLSDPMQGRPSSAKRTAKEIQMTMQSAGVRLDLMAARIRQWAKAVFWQIHQLKIQYGPDSQQVSTSQDGQPQQLLIDKQKLQQDYTLDISGAGGPLDKQQLRQDVLFLYQALMQNPLVQGDMSKVYRVTRAMIEQYDLGDPQVLIGTEEEAVQKQQAMEQAQAQAQQQEQQMQMAGLAAKSAPHQTPQKQPAGGGPKLPGM